MPIPVTLLCGYLGAGKTTLINHLLSAADGPRITVLVNDFGAINVDARLIADKGADAITLTNGCACCSIDDDLGSALQAQLARAASIEHIVIEASGVAEPHRLAASIEAWPDLKLEAVVSVADARTVRARAQDKFVGRLVLRQLQAADILVLNKIDLADVSEIAGVKAWLGALASDARLIEATNGAVPPATLFSTARPRNLARGTPEEGDEDHATHFHSTTVPLHMNLDPAGLRRILLSAPAAIHRVKGFVRDDAGRVMLVQSTGGRVSIEPYDASGEPVPMALVCIATDPSALDAFTRALVGWVLSTRQASKAAARKSQ